MAKKSTGAKTAMRPGGKLAGKAIAFVGKFGYGNGELKTLEKYAENEGASIVDGLTKAPDILVEGDGRGGNPPAAVATIRKKHPAVQVVDRAGFFQLVLPTRDELIAEFKSPRCDDERREFLNGIYRMARARIDLSGADLRGANLSSIRFQNADLDDADLRGAKLHFTHFPRIKGARFDGADAESVWFDEGAVGCSFRKAKMDRAYGSYSNRHFSDCDFTDATMTDATFQSTQFADCVFRGADLSDAELRETKFLRADFTGANLSRAHASESKFGRADFTKAVFKQADLRNASLAGARLDQAVFTEAVLAGADLTGASVKGADFSGAVLTDAKLAGVDLAQAKNLRPATDRPVGPRLAEFAKHAAASANLMTLAEVELGTGGYAELRLERKGSRLSASFSYHQEHDYVGGSVNAPTVEKAIANFADRFPQGTLRLDTVKVITNRKFRGIDIRELAMAAWAEAFGMTFDSTADLRAIDDQQKAELQALRAKMLGEFGGGPAGVKKWNRRTQRECELIGPLAGLDFADGKLDGVRAHRLSLEGSQFRGASLRKAALEHCNLVSTDFRDVNLEGGRLACSHCDNTSFENANLRDCDMVVIYLHNADLRNADLTGANLRASKLQGADFTGARIDGVNFDDAEYDGATRFPAGFTPTPTMTLVRTPGVPPPQPAEARKPGSLDFDSFFAQLPDKIDPGRLANAKSMLKAERFQLFADVKDDSVTGVVRSQSTQERVYSCRLAADGSFGCCTQNLRPCGGLQGSLCKHLLVLVVGLAKAGKLDPAAADNWIDASRLQKPAIDKELMSETFIRYKGAEAGELDWRPTETLPEDFYAL